MFICKHVDAEAENVQSLCILFVFTQQLFRFEMLYRILQFNEIYFNEFSLWI